MPFKLGPRKAPQSKIHAFRHVYLGAFFLGVSFTRLEEFWGFMLGPHVMETPMCGVNTYE